MDERRDKTSDRSVEGKARKNDTELVHQMTALFDEQNVLFRHFGFHQISFRCSRCEGEETDITQRKEEMGQGQARCASLRELPIDFIDHCAKRFELI